MQNKKTKAAFQGADFFARNFRAGHLGERPFSFPERRNRKMWMKLEIQIEVADGTQQLKEIVDAALDGMRKLKNKNIYTNTDYCPIQAVGEAQITSVIYRN